MKIMRAEQNYKQLLKGILDSINVHGQINK